MQIALVRRSQRLETKLKPATFMEAGESERIVPVYKPTTTHLKTTDLYKTSIKMHIYFQYI